MPSALPASWDLPASILSRVGRASGRQRIMHADGQLLIILHALPHAQDANRTARLFWRKPDGSWQSNEYGGGIAALNRHLEEFDKHLEQLDDVLEDNPKAEQLFELIRELTPLLRATRNLHVALQQAREALPDDSDLIDARDRAGQIERNTELLFSDAKHALDFNMAQQAELQSQHNQQMNVAAHRLNTLIATFFPLVTLTGVFGMNLVTGYEGHPSAFWIVIAAGICSGLAATPLFFPKKSKSRGPAGKGFVAPIRSCRSLTRNLNALESAVSR